MTHACPGTWFPAQDENSEAPALGTELNSITNTNTQASTSSFPPQDTEIESNDNTTEAVVNSPFTGVTDFHPASLTPSTDPVDDDRVAFGDVESIVYSDDSSSTVVPRVPTPRPRPAQLSLVTTSSALDSAAVESSIPSLTEPQTENTRVNGIVHPAVSSTESSPAIVTPTASTSSRPRSNTRPRATTRARSATVSNHVFDAFPAQTEAFPDFVDTPPQNNTTLVNGVNGVHGVTTTTSADENEAPLPSAEVLSRRTRREEIHYSDQVRGNILANIFGRSAVDERGRLLPDTEGGPVCSSFYARPDTPPVDDSDSSSDSGDIDTSSRQAASTSDAQASNTSYRQAYSDAQASNNSYGRAPATYSHVSPLTNGTLTNGQTPRYGQRFTYRGLSTSNQASTPSGQASTYSRSSSNRQGSTTLQPISETGVSASSSYGRPSNSGQASTSGQSPNYAQASTNPGSSSSRQNRFSRTFSTHRGGAFDFFAQILASRQAPTSGQSTSYTQASTNPGSSTTGQASTSAFDQGSTSEQTSTTEQASASEQASISGQDSTTEQASTSTFDQGSTSEQTSTTEQASGSEQASTSRLGHTSQAASTYEQDSSIGNSSSTSTGTSNNNPRNSRNNRSSGPEDCKPYIEGITRFRRDEDEGDDGSSSTSTGGFTGPNNAYNIASMSLNQTSNNSGSNNNTTSGNNNHSANSSQGLFTNFLDNSNNNTANMNMSRQGTPSSSPGPQHPANQVNGSSGVPGMGMGMNMPMNAGHQMDLNHLYEMVLELSDVLKNNRDMTKGIISSAEEIMVSAFVYFIFAFLSLFLWYYCYFVRFSPLVLLFTSTRLE